ncbi:SLC13 family permease [Eubacteriaceae bacterium ES3]|nr:SLC13 family permease [Eubacteriaceae bacterium ES3]
MSKKQILGMALGIIVLIAFYLLPVPEGLTSNGMITVGLLLFFLIMLITEALPVGVTCFLCLALLPTLGITKNLGSALSGFTNTILFFVLASFGLAEAVTSTPIVNRVLHALLKKFGKNVKTCVLAIMIAAAVVSSIITDVPSVVVFMGIGEGFLQLFKNEEDRKQTAKSLMMGIPIAVMLGGLMTLAGSGINILTVGLLQSIAGIQVTFLQWMVCSIPIAIIMVPLSWFVLTKVFPPAEIDVSEISEFMEQIEVKENVSSREWKVITIATAMMFFWVISSFFPFIEVAVVSLFGCVLFFMPGIEVISWKQYMKAVSWTSYILIGSVLCIANTIVANGVSEWFVTYVLPSSLSLSLRGGVFFVASMIFLIMLIVPVAPALIGVLTPVIIVLAETMGINPEFLIVTLGLCAGNCYLFPIDTIPLITYTAGYYKMTEMPKATIWLQVAFVLLATIWLPVAGLMF